MVTIRKELLIEEGCVWKVKAAAMEAVLLEVVLWL